MTDLQEAVIGTYGIIAAGLFTVAVYAVAEKLTYQKNNLINIFGAFVWGDMLVFGPFWAIVSIISILSGSLWLFLLIFFSFWLIRSVGETIYWFNQQFSKVVREKPENIWFYKYIRSDAVWFIFQIWWQCISVISLVLLILVILNK